MAEIRRVDFKKIEGLRLDAGLNLTQFCHKAGICTGTYNRLQGADRVTDDVVLRIAKCLKVKPSQLIYWQDEIKPDSGEGPAKSKRLCLMEKARTG